MFFPRGDFFTPSEDIFTPRGEKRERERERETEETERERERERRENPYYCLILPNYNYPSTMCRGPWPGCAKTRNRRQPRKHPRTADTSQLHDDCFPRASRQPSVHPSR